MSFYAVDLNRLTCIIALAEGGACLQSMYQFMHLIELIDTYMHVSWILYDGYNAV